MHPTRGFTLRHRMSSHGFVNYLTHAAIAHEVLRRNLSVALIVEDDAAQSLPARRGLRPRGLLHAIDSLAQASPDFSVIYVGGGQAIHASPTWPEVAHVSVRGAAGYYTPAQTQAQAQTQGAGLARPSVAAASGAALYSGRARVVSTYEI